MIEVFKNDWNEVIGGELEKPYFLELKKFLDHEYEVQTVYPDVQDIFNAFHYTSYANLKVVLLGQDPYHGPGQAHGLRLV